MISIIVSHFDYKHRCLVEKNVPIALILPSRWQDGAESLGIERTSCLGFYSIDRPSSSLNESARNYNYVFFVLADDDDDGDDDGACSVYFNIQENSSLEEENACFE